MANLKQRLHRKNAAGSYDVIYLETSAELVKRADGVKSVEASLTEIEAWDPIRYEENGTVPPFLTTVDADTLQGKAADQFATATHDHDASDIVRGILSLSRGGTGVGTIDELKNLLGVSSGTGAPTGSIFWYASTIIPDGYLLCDGRLVNKADYQNLFSVLGDTFGTSTDTQFYLPDLKAKFIRGAGTNTHKDNLGTYTAVFGETQEASIFSQASRGDAVSTRDLDFSGWKGEYGITGASTDGDKTYRAFRPYNIVLTPIIKY